MSVFNGRQLTTNISITRNARIDLLKLALALMIVALHADNPGSPSYLNHIFVNGIFRIAVPIFFIINGFYLFNRISNGYSLIPWVRRLLFMYTLWMLLYMPFYYPHGSEKYISFVFKLLTGYVQFWYLIALLLAGILLFLLRKRPDIELIIISLVLYGVGLILQYISFYSQSEIGLLIQKHYFIYRNFLFFAFPMATIGYIIRKRDLVEKWRHISNRWLVLIGLLLIILESSVNYFLGAVGEGSEIYLSALFVCPVIFIWTSRGRRIFNTDIFSRMATAIYCTHYLFLRLGTNLVLPNSSINVAKLFVFALMLSALISFPLVKLNQRLGFIL